MPSGATWAPSPPTPNRLHPARHRFLAETPVSFPILFDPSNEVSKQYGVSAMPSTVIVDREGNVRFLHHGYQPGYENAYQNQIRELVRE